MKNIEIKVNRNTSMVDPDNHMLGNDGENLQGDIIFSFVNGFVDGQARLEYKIEGEKRYLSLTKDEKTYKTPIKSVLTKSGAINMQLVITEGVNEEEIPIFKSNVFYVYCNDSLNAEIEQPDEYPSWIEIANTKLNEFEQGLVEIKTQSMYAKEQGDYASEQGKFAQEQAENVQSDILNIRNIADESNEKSDTAISIAKGANQTLDYKTYQDMITNFNAFEKEMFSTGQNVMIKQLNVPDMWIYQLTNEYVSYTYTTDEEVINLLLSDNGFHVGYYVLSALETQKVDLTNYIKNTDVATSTKAGVIKAWTSTNEDGEIGLNISTEV